MIKMFSCLRRRDSFQSSRSVPALTLEGRASGRSTKSDSAKLRRKNERKNKKEAKHSEVGIRTVHTAYKAHHGFLALLKQRFSRSSSRDRDGVRLHEASQSANATPEATRRPLQVDRPPEIVRIRNEVAAASIDASQSVEIFRHCTTPGAPGAAMAAPGPASVAEVVRHKMTPADHVRLTNSFYYL